MVEFDYSPTLDFLHLLTRGSLKQNLAKAVRLWVILRSLYGSENDPLKLDLSNNFHYNQWRNKFFQLPEKNLKKGEIVFHKKRDEIPLQHRDPNCHCHKTLTEWLLKSDFGVEEELWKKNFCSTYSTSAEELKQLLSLPDLNGRLFAVTGKNLQDNDFRALVQLKWLEKISEHKYRKVSRFPEYLNNSSNNQDKFEFFQELIKQPDLAAIVNSHCLPINGVQRFFIQANYVVQGQKGENIDNVNDYAEILKNIWSQDIITPIKMLYDSASSYKTTKLLVYPVCIYYFERALYLCAMGETPKKGKGANWYNYRLDRIKSITPLSWEAIDVPQNLKNLKTANKLPTPASIEEKMSESWGFDFYQPSELMLLRFDQYFHENYIENSSRHETFKLIPSLEQVKETIDKAKTSTEEKKILIKRVNQHPEGAYYQAQYRVNDNNIIMRLRAWGPNVEVLLPPSLRHKIAEESAATSSLYSVF